MQIQGQITSTTAPDTTAEKSETHLVGHFPPPPGPPVRHMSIPKTPEAAADRLTRLADVDGDGRITRNDAQYSETARRLLQAADTGSSYRIYTGKDDSSMRGGFWRGRPDGVVSRDELVQYTTRKAGKDGRFDTGEYFSMMRELGAPRHSTKPKPPVDPKPPIIPPPPPNDGDDWNGCRHHHWPPVERSTSIERVSADLMRQADSDGDSRVTRNDGYLAQQLLNYSGYVEMGSFELRQLASSFDRLPHDGALQDAELGRMYQAIFAPTRRFDYPPEFAAQRVGEVETAKNTDSATV